MSFSYTCDYCGSPFTRQNRASETQLRFCGLNCRDRYNAEKQRIRYSKTRIRITKAMNIFPELAPKIGAEFAAEHYKNGAKSLGYVIEINGKRINVRCDECIEI